ncbi:CASP-like protein 5A2 isoform X2 [Salvia divinorum]|uniref:CASP-like protein n=1 Tax=Salvia divinorum TaxID=28513 RepID=A0ABD1GLV0_SALDI
MNPTVKKPTQLKQITENKRQPLVLLAYMRRSRTRCELPKHIVYGEMAQRRRRPARRAEVAEQFCKPVILNHYLVAATGLQSIWSIVLGITDAYALLVGRRLQNPRAVRLFAVSDGVTSNLTFAAACASAGITVLIGNDLGSCGKNHCTEFETATAMAFLSWFAALPSFLLNFWSVASR